MKVVKPLLGALVLVSSCAWAGWYDPPMLPPATPAVVAPVAPQTVVVVPAPAPRVEVVPVYPGPGYVWAGGYWSWNPRISGRVWIGGHWAINPLPGLVIGSGWGYRHHHGGFSPYIRLRW